MGWERVIKIEDFGPYQQITTLMREGRLWRWLNLGPREHKYRGSCTVWHSYPDGRRCNIQREKNLCEAWQRWVWSRK